MLKYFVRPRAEKEQKTRYINKRILTKDLTFPNIFEICAFANKIKLREQIDPQFTSKHNCFICFISIGQKVYAVSNWGDDSHTQIAVKF